MKKIYLVMACILLASCEKEQARPEDLGANAGIVGTWVEVEDEGMHAAEDGLTLLDRREELDEGRYGFILREDGTFLERKNAGWCGTPPITYGNFEGTWRAVSDSLLDIVVAYWGGVMTYQIRIASVDEDQLSIRYFFSDERLEAVTAFP